MILATGFIHVLPDAFADLTSPCLNQNPWGIFPFTGFFAMLSSIETLMVDAYATSYFNKMHFNSQVKSYIQYHYYAYISDFFSLITFLISLFNFFNDVFKLLLKHMHAGCYR